MFLDPAAKFIKISDKTRGRFHQFDGRTYFKSTYRVKIATIYLYNIIYRFIIYWW
jgi:hypothetical protein